MRLSRPSTFRDRREAGRMLAARLAELELADPVVIALPRGGVPVGFEVARRLGAPLDVGLVRKLGHPSQPELGIGAIGEDGSVVVDRRAIEAFRIDDEQIEAIAAREAGELDRRRRLYRGDVAAVAVRDRNVIVVDDGIATGVTAAAAARVLRAQGAGAVTLAVPVCPAGTPERLGAEIDRVVALAAPERFGSVGAWYDDFSQTTDEEVVDLLAACRSEGSVGRGEVTIPTADGARLAGDLDIPADPIGLVVFVHGSGSSRHSPRNRSVARYLGGRGFATLLFDLLTPEEGSDRRKVFDIGLLSRRLGDAIRWSRTQGGVAGLPIAGFGASTGAAAALSAAADPGAGIAVVVSRGGRPDLAGAALTRVGVPVLLIVGGDDAEVIELNEAAAERIAGPCRIAIVPGAGHLFEEGDTLVRAARLAADFLEETIGAG